MRQALLLLIAISTATAEPWLSDEGKTMLAAHELLFGQLAGEHEAELDESGTLKRLKLKGTAFEINGKAEIELPAGVEQVAQFMRYFELHGSGLDTLGSIRLLPLAPKSNMNVSTKTASVYRVKVPALPTPGADTPSFKLALEGKASISRIDLVPFSKGIRREFDRSPYSNLGHEFPPTKLTLGLDLEHELSIGGHIDLQRDKWFRYYGRPGSLPEDIERFASERGFQPGRQMFKFEPALERGYNKRDPKLKEDPTRKGFADPTFWERYQDGLFANMKTRGYADDFAFAMCLNDYPSFMSRHPNGRGTPKVESFDAAAELVVGYLKNQINDSGRTATWWELKNEASIKAEWDYHWLKEYDSWALMAEFHGKVADAVHHEVPGVKIGGPASAWMQVQVGDFTLWNSQARFMDLTKGKMDFYSHHFYEDAGTLAAFDRRQQGYSNYLLGRMPAVLDLFRAHMEATDNVRPMLITETGALNIGGSEADYWLRLRTYSAYLTQYMSRPDQLDLVVPFIFLHAPWDPTNAHSAFIPDETKEGKAFKRTHCAHFFDLWKDFDGRRLPVRSPEKHVHAIAVHKGDKLHIAISNMTNRRVEVNLGHDLPATQRRLYRLNAEIRYEDATEVRSTDIPLEVEETTVVTLTLPKSITPKGTLEMARHYAPQRVTKEREFTIALDSAKDLKRAELVIGLQKDGELTVPIRGQINGHRFEQATDWAKGVKNLFEQAIIELPADQLAEKNSIELEIPDDKITISEVHLRTWSAQNG